LNKRHDHLQVVLKDYELKIENIKLVTQNTLHDFPGNISTSYLIIDYKKDPSELEIKISHLKDELFHVQQLIAKHNNENNDKAALNKQKIVLEMRTLNLS